MPKENEVQDVDSPDKWTAADTITADVQIETLDGMVKFKVKAASNEQYSRIKDGVKFPEAPMVSNFRGVPSANTDDEEYQKASALAELKRRVLWIDTCWMEIPGDNLDMKVQWASENLWHKNELKQLWEQVLRVSGFQKQVFEQSSAMPVIITDPKAWAESARRPARLIITRVTGDVLAFVLKPISRIISLQIDQACPLPEVPEIPAPGKAGRLRQFVKNDSDPAYLAKVKAVNDRKTVLMIEASVDWKIPGDNFEVKTAWLNARPAGEISMIYSSIVNTVNNFQSRSDFM